MTVYTHISDQQVVDLLSNNTIGSLQNYLPMPAGHMNSNYIIQTSDGEYILTIFEYIDTTNLVTKLEYEQFLTKHNFPCSPAIANLEGKLIQTIASKPCKLSKFIPGNPNPEPSEAQCFAVGELLAKLHQKSAGYASKLTHPRHYDWQLDAAERVMPMLSTADGLLLQEEMGFQKLLKYDLVPKGIIHANCLTQNVLFADNKITGLLDFYYVCYDYYVIDLAITINAFAKNLMHQFDEVKVTTIIDGYQHHRQLSKLELKLLDPMRRTTALQIWVERLVSQFIPSLGIGLPPQDPNEYKIVLQQLSKIPNP